MCKCLYIGRFFSACRWPEKLKDKMFLMVLEKLHSTAMATQAMCTLCPSARFSSVFSRLYGWLTGELTDKFLLLSSYIFGFVKSHFLSSFSFSSSSDPQTFFAVICLRKGSLFICIVSVFQRDSKTTPR